MSRKQVESEYWICIIGGTNSKNLPHGADAPLRSAVREAFNKTTGHYDDNCCSGWGAEKPKVDVLNAVWSMEKEDPIYLAIEAMLKGTGLL